MYLVASIRLSVHLSVRPSATKSKEESLSVQGVCLCVEYLCGCGPSAFNYFLSGEPPGVTNDPRPRVGFNIDLWRKYCTFYVIIGDNKFAINFNNSVIVVPLHRGNRNYSVTQNTTIQ